MGSIYRREQRRKENMDNSVRDFRGHFLTVLRMISAQISLIRTASYDPTKGKVLGNVRWWCCKKRKMEFRYWWALPLSIPWHLCKIMALPFGGWCVSLSSPHSDPVTMLCHFSSSYIAMHLVKKEFIFPLPVSLYPIHSTVIWLLSLLF